MIQEFKIKGTPEVYTIAVNSCSGNGDWEFACSVFDDMTKNGIIPDEVLLTIFFCNVLKCIQGLLFQGKLYE